jgi:hypothetical protein
MLHIHTSPIGMTDQPKAKVPSFTTFQLTVPPPPQFPFWNTHTFNQCSVDLNDIYRCDTAERKALQTILFALNPRSSVIFEKLTFPQLLSTFLAFYGTWRFMTMFPTSSHWTYPEPAWYSPHPRAIFHTHSRIILPSIARLCNKSFLNILT